MDILYWKEFCDTYDIQYLNFMSHDGREVLKTFINKNVKLSASRKGKNYKGLQRLITLYFDQSWKNIPYCQHLHGISSLSYHRKDSVKIYIFGENIISFPARECQAFKYILNVLRNEPKFMDIFININRISPSTIDELSNVKFHDIIDPNNVNLFTPGREKRTNNNNIILFIDEKYTNKYRQLLRDNKFKTVNYSTLNEFSYVVIDKFKLPLFS